MKKIVFTYSGYAYTNIGDYIQSLAAEQFITDKSEIIKYHRDELKNYDGDPAKVIMNGWFTHKPENWPPSSKIKPLFVAFHINSSAYTQLLSEESIKYLKQFEPIGCRDKKTVEKLQNCGVEAYFSSCLTTTLGYKYGGKKHGDKIYIVDPVHYVPELNSRIRKYKFLYYYLRHLRGINKYIKNIKSNSNYDFSFSPKYFDRFVALVRSYLIVSQILSKADLEKVIVLTQFHKDYEYPTDEKRFQRAEHLLRMYSEAKFVITSRIHCALPCIGLGTPVLFLKNLDDSDESTCRFEGLMDLFNTISFRRNKIVNSAFELPLKVNNMHNSNKYRVYADQLILKVKSFL